MTFSFVNELKLEEFIIFFVMRNKKKLEKELI